AHPEREAPATASATWQAARDLRPAFRHALCAQPPTAGTCTQILRRLPGEPAQAHLQSPATPAATLARRWRLAFVPGLLSGCAGARIAPFQDVVQALQAQGFDARILSVDGRGSSARNADLLAGQLGQLP